MKATVFHDIRTGDRVFLCIAMPEIDGSIASAKEASKAYYQVEREIFADVTPDIIRAAINEMKAESGLDLKPSETLREMGV